MTGDRPPPGDGRTDPTTPLGDRHRPPPRVGGRGTVEPAHATVPGGRSGDGGGRSRLRGLRPVPRREGERRQASSSRGRARTPSLALVRGRAAAPRPRRPSRPRGGVPQRCGPSSCLSGPNGRCRHRRPGAAFRCQSGPTRKTASDSPGCRSPGEQTTRRGQMSVSDRGPPPGRTGLAPPSLSTACPFGRPTARYSRARVAPPAARRRARAEGDSPGLQARPRQTSAPVSRELQDGLPNYPARGARTTARAALRR